MSSEHFLLWACLIERGPNTCEAICRTVPTQMTKLQTLYTHVSSSHYQPMAIKTAIFTDTNHQYTHFYSFHRFRLSHLRVVYPDKQVIIQNPHFWGSHEAICPATYHYKPSLLGIEHFPSTYLDLLGCTWIFFKVNQSKSKYFQVSLLGKCSISSR